MRPGGETEVVPVCPRVRQSAVPALVYPPPVHLQIEPPLGLHDQPTGRLLVCHEVPGHQVDAVYGHRPGWAVAAVRWAKMQPEWECRVLPARSRRGQLVIRRHDLAIQIQDAEDPVWPGYLRRGQRTGRRPRAETGLDPSEDES